MKDYLIKVLGGYTKKEYKDVLMWVDADVIDLGFMQYTSDMELNRMHPDMAFAFSEKTTRDMVYKIANEMIQQKLVVIETIEDVKRMGRQTRIKARVLKPRKH